MCRRWERARRRGWTEGRNGPVCISALLSLEEVFINKSVSRAWWNICVRVRVHVYIFMHLCVWSRRHVHVHVCDCMCVHVVKIFCVFTERNLLNYLQVEHSNWYQVFKWGQMLWCSSTQLFSLPEVCTIISTVLLLRWTWMVSAVFAHLSGDVLWDWRNPTHQAELQGELSFLTLIGPCESISRLIQRKHFVRELASGKHQTQVCTHVA